MLVSAQRQLEPLETEAFGRASTGACSVSSPGAFHRDSAEDILQDVMLRIHRHAAELEHAPAVGACVHQIARNAIVDYYRRAPVRRERPAGIDLDREEQLVLEQPSMEPRSELAECLGLLLRRLPAFPLRSARADRARGALPDECSGSARPVDVRDEVPRAARPRAAEAAAGRAL